MNKTAIKNFAIWARVQLMEAARQRAYEYEITENGENKPGLDTIGGRLITSEEKTQRRQLISQIESKGFAQVMEEAAYTWFNRFVALRYMEVNGFLPSKVRVFTDENGAFKPEILKEAMTVQIEGLDRELVLDLLDKQNNEQLYKYLLITQCNALNEGLPYLFEKISNWTELLFPANLLRADSIIGRLISDIDAADFEEEVEIIGWLYQFYISEKHEAVVDPLHGKVIKKEDIPAATQLFTTDWVVRYILDNSLGRYWLERHPESRLAEKLTYLIVPQEGGFALIDEQILPEELKVFDPCVGSGHFLSYAFDILLEIYRECGWSDRDAAKSILENNLYGLDIDDRAVQLACFALAMKARKYNRRILNGDTALNILAMQDADNITDDFARYFANGDETLKQEIYQLRMAFDNAKEYGSLIFAPKGNYAALYDRIDAIGGGEAEDIFQMEYQRMAQELLLPLVKQAEIMSGKYDIVATNPPYMNKFSPRLKDYIQQHFADYKGDLFSVFMFRNFAFCKEKGYSGFMTPNVWMFIKSYEELRRYIINQKSIASLIQMAKGAFFKEATVDVCAFVLSNERNGEKGLYIRLEDFKGDMEVQKQKVLEALSNRACGYFYEVDQADFAKIPGSPIAYWVRREFLDVLERSVPLEKQGYSFQGIITGDNQYFLRLWQEVSAEKTKLHLSNHERGEYENIWVPYNKGGAYRRWYGNNEYLLRWTEQGKTLTRARTENVDYYFRPGVTWSFITSGTFSARYFPQGALWDVAGSSIFEKGGLSALSICALLNSKFAQFFFDITNPTINYQVMNILAVPYVENDVQNRIECLAGTCINLSQKDWDSYETSWDFQKHPLV